MKIQILVSIGCPAVVDFMKVSGALPPGHAVLERLYGFRDTRKGAI